MHELGRLLINYLWYSRLQWRDPFWCEARRVYITLTLVELLLVLEQTPVVVVPQCEGSRGARRRYFKQVDYLLPQLVVGNSLRSATQDDGLEQFAEVEFFATD